MNSMRSVYWLAFLTLACFIGWIIYQADMGQSNIFLTLVKRVPLGDKLGHIWLYGALAFLLNLSLALRQVHIKSTSIYWGSLIVVVFALLEECSQGLFATRTLDAMDLIADAIGIGLADFILRRKSQAEVS